MGEWSVNLERYEFLEKLTKKAKTRQNGNLSGETVLNMFNITPNMQINTDVFEDGKSNGLKSFDTQPDGILDENEYQKLKINVEKTLTQGLKLSEKDEKLRIQRRNERLQERFNNFRVNTGNDTFVSDDATNPATRDRLVQRQLDNIVAQTGNNSTSEVNEEGRTTKLNLPPTPTDEPVSPIQPENYPKYIIRNGKAYLPDMNNRLHKAGTPYDNKTKEINLNNRKYLQEILYMIKSGAKEEDVINYTKNKLSSLPENQQYEFLASLAGCFNTVYDYSSTGFKQKPNGNSPEEGLVNVLTGVASGTNSVDGSICTAAAQRIIHIFKEVFPEKSAFVASVASNDGDAHAVAIIRNNDKTYTLINYNEIYKSESKDLSKALNEASAHTSFHIPNRVRILDENGKEIFTCTTGNNGTEFKTSVDAATLNPDGTPKPGVNLTSGSVYSTPNNFNANYRTITTKQNGDTATVLAANIDVSDKNLSKEINIDSIKTRFIDGVEVKITENTKGDIQINLKSTDITFEKAIEIQKKIFGDKNFYGFVSVGAGGEITITSGNTATNVTSGNIESGIGAGIHFCVGPDTGIELSVNENFKSYWGAHPENAQQYVKILGDTEYGIKLLQKLGDGTFTAEFTQENCPNGQTNTSFGAAYTDKDKNGNRLTVGAGMENNRGNGLSAQKVFGTVEYNNGNNSFGVNGKFNKDSGNVRFEWRF